MNQWFLIQRVGSGKDKKKSVFKLILSVAVCCVLGVVGLFILWAGFWSFYNPYVEVPKPEHFDFSSIGGDQTGQVLFLGDFGTGDKAQPAIKRNGYGYQFSKTKPLLKSFDAVVANLESTITQSKTKWILPKKWSYKAHPNYAAHIKKAGIDIVTLANNHTYDYGRDGLRDTMKNLDNQHIKHIGAHMSEAEARRGIVIDSSGGKIGVLSYMQNSFEWRVWTGAFAFDTPFKKFAGVAQLNYLDLKKDIERMKSEADIVVVVVHFGKNYKSIDKLQMAIGKASIDFGADVVMGHHPHQYQPVQVYKNRPVIYSLGNYAWGTNGNKKMMFGMGAAIHLKGGSLTQIEFIPLLTQNRIVKFRPRVLNKKYSDVFFKDFIEQSAKLGATIQRAGNRGFLKF